MSQRRAITTVARSPKVVPMDKWQDVLGRRLALPARHVRTLRVAPDGRLAAVTSVRASVVDPARALAAAKRVDEREVDDEILRLQDRTSSIASQLRTPVVGAEVVFGADRVVDKSKEGPSPYDVTTVAWSPGRDGPVLLVVQGNRSCFFLVPVRSGGRLGSDGTWGSVLGEPWHQLNDPVAGVNSNNTADGSDTPRTKSCTDVVDTGILCAIFVTLANGPETASPSLADAGGQKATFIALGTRSGVILRKWNGPRGVLGPPATLHAGWTNSLAWLPSDALGEVSWAKLAVGGPAGEVFVYAVTLLPGGIHAQPVWQILDPQCFGPVSDLSWGLYASESGGRVLAAAIGNGIAAMEWSAEAACSHDEALWSNPNVVLLCPAAHEQLATAVQVMVDGSLVSGSLAGDVQQWHMAGGVSDTSTLSLVRCKTVYSTKAGKDPIMSMERSTNGVALNVLICSRRPNTEVGDESQEMKLKYAASARRAMLSMFMPPLMEACHMLDIVFLAVSRLLNDAQFAGEPLSLWDVGQWLTRFDEGDTFTLSDSFNSALLDKLESLVLQCKPTAASAERSGASAHHLRKVSLSYTRMLEQIGSEKDYARGMKLARIRNELTRDVLAQHYLYCLTLFDEGASSVSKESESERMSLEAMCTFALTAPNVSAGSSENHALLTRVRERIGPNATDTLCPVCAYGTDKNPLVADADDPHAFVCCAGDFFSRCVVRGFPCTDAVPLVCSICESRSRSLGIELFEQSSEFAWIRNATTCPLCNGPLLPSTVELLH